MRAALLISTTIVSSLLWTIALLVEPRPLQSVPALLVGIGILAMATVATVGMIVVGGRWAHRLGVASLGITIIIAVARPIDTAWVVALAATTTGLACLLSPVVRAGIRRLPSASGPPARAVVPPLLLISAPALFGLAGNDVPEWALLTLGLSALNFAVLYIRVFPGGLIGIRLIWPLLAIGTAPVLGWPQGLVAVVLGLAVAVLAWDRSVKASYHPPRQVGSTFPIPPELAPRDVLDAAEIDDTGRRL